RFGRRPAGVDHRRSRPDSRARGRRRGRPRHPRRTAGDLSHVRRDRGVADRADRSEPGMSGGLKKPDTTKTPFKPPIQPNQPGGRWGTVGMPLGKASNFKVTLKRLFERLSGERLKLAAVIIFSLCGVSFSVVGPKLLGHATDILVRGLFFGPK